MNRVETTKFLGELLKRDRFSGMGKYWASEVSIDAFTTAGKGGRVDFMQFKPPNQCSVGALEILRPCIIGSRKKSLTEMLFCMVRSGK